MGWLHMHDEGERWVSASKWNHNDNITFENFTPISTSWRIPSWLVSIEHSTVKWSDCALSDWVQRDDKQNLSRSLKKMYRGKKDYLDAQHHGYLSTQWSSFVACTLHWEAARSIGALLSTSWSCSSLIMVQHTCRTLRMLPRITLAAWFNARFSQSKSYRIAGNFRWVQIFAIFADRPASAKIKTAKKCTKMEIVTSLRAYVDTN